MNIKLIHAIDALSEMRWSVDKRDELMVSVRLGNVSIDDPWVAAALGCVNDADIPDIALEFFLADVKSGLYDLEQSHDNHDIEPIASP